MKFVLFVSRMRNLVSLAKNFKYLYVGGKSGENLIPGLGDVKIQIGIYL